MYIYIYMYTYIRAGMQMYAQICVLVCIYIHTYYVSQGLWAAVEGAYEIVALLTFIQVLSWGL